MQRLRLDAETVFLFTSLKCSRSEFSIFIIRGNKGMTEVLKPTEIHTPRTCTQNFTPNMKGSDMFLSRVWDRRVTSASRQPVCAGSVCAFFLNNLQEKKSVWRIWRWCILAQIRPPPPEKVDIQMDTMTRDIQHDSAQTDPGVDNTHVSTQEIVNRKMSEAPV